MAARYVTKSGAATFTTTPNSTFGTSTILNAPTFQPARIMTDLESKSLLERPLDPDLAKATLNEIHAGQGQRIFKVIFKHLSENAPSKAMAVQAAMTKFEKIMQSSTELGIYLMCQLDSIAGKFNHEVYNAIELWALSLRSEQAAAMVELCAADAGPHRRARLLNWARVMRSPGA